MKRTILIIASSMMLIACGGNGARLTEQQMIDNGEAGYSDIVSFIADGFRSNWAETKPEDMGLSSVYSYRSPYAGFAKKDIDGDGFNEFVIGDAFENGSYALYDIFCFNKKDASLIHLASGGERDRFTVSGDGTIVEQASNSAEDSFTKGFRIKKDRLVEEKQGWEDSMMEFQFERFSDLAAAERKCGGYTRQRELSEEEMAMFKAVTASCGMTLTPLSVSTQVVAGTNYRFWCRYQDSEGSGHCWVTVFKPLPGRGEPEVSAIDKEE